MATIQTSLQLTDGMSSGLKSINNSLRGVTDSFKALETASANPASVTDVQEIGNELTKAALAIDSATNTYNNIEWKTPKAAEIFTNSGIERYSMELQSANEMMYRLSATQQRIQAQASNTGLFPANMVNDLTAINIRIEQLRTALEEASKQRIDISGAKQAGNAVESLRNELNQAVSLQDELSAAMAKMDISEANAAYNRLNSIIDSSERSIRDNISDQNRFNQAVRNGGNEASFLKQKITGIAAAYMTFQGGAKILGLSDTLTQTTARLNMMNDGLRNSEELQQMIFQAAERSRGSYHATADAVSKMGIMAKDAFSGNAELIAFTEQLNKQFAIAGTSAQGVDAAMLQLTQAMGSGVLRGEELNSIFEQAPTIIQAIAGYLDAPIGKIRDMAQEGMLTADVVKAALLSAADETDTRFNQMPKTFGQIGQSIQNNTLMAFQPVLDRLNDIANSDSFNVMVNNSINALTMLGNTACGVFDMMVQSVGLISDNWGLIAPVIYGVVAALAIYNGYLLITNSLEAISRRLKLTVAIASFAHAVATGTEASATAVATVAQWGLNTALLACPLTWIIILIIAFIATIYGAVAVINKFAGTSVSATGIVAGTFAALGAFIYNTFIVPTQNALAIFANFFANVFNNPTAAVKVLFYDLAQTVIGYITTMAHAIENIINKIPGVEISITTGLDNFYNRLESASQRVKDESGWVEVVKKLEYKDMTAAYNSGYQFGEGIAERFSMDKIFGGSAAGPSGAAGAGFDYDSFANRQGAVQVAGQGGGLAGGPGETGSGTVYEPVNNKGIANTAANTATIRDQMEMTGENLKYLRDIAEREAINKFTTAEIKVELTNNNNISSDFDINRMGDYLRTVIEESMMSAAEGVHA